MQDVTRLPNDIVRKADNVLADVRAFGPRHPPLHTRRIERNSDGRFHYMNVDDKYRVVVALDGDVVFFERVGNHDDVLAWGERATLREYQDRVEVDSLSRKRDVAPIAAPASTPELIQMGVTLPQIAEQQELVSDLVASDLFGTLEGYRDGSLEDWMIFLSPIQRRAVSRAINGPARVTGGPGTGKTVVGLHRAVEFARHAPGRRRVLVTSYVHNVPEVLDGLAERLSPDLHERLEFRTIHSLAGRILAERGRSLNVDEPAARSRFTRRLEGNAHRAEILRRAGFNEQYLWDEITRVIEGREVRAQNDYLALARHGRRQRMGITERQLVWDLYSEYREACDRLDPPIASWTWQVAEARRALTVTPVAQRYRAIVVDEAQDLTESGVRLLLDVLENGREGQILLIGDNAQRIYAGGFRLSDVGAEVRGRSFSLSLCYRSTDEIMRAAAALSSYVSSEHDDWSRDSAWQPVRTGKRPTLREFPTMLEERAFVTASVQERPLLRDATAILVATNKLRDQWKQTLRDAGLDVCDLREYLGRPTSGVKVGTYNYAKGLEFKRVIMPNLSAYAIRADPNRLDELIARGSTLYVAMTRARDELDMSYAGEPAVFVDPLLEHVDVL